MSDKSGSRAEFGLMQIHVAGHDFRGRYLLHGAAYTRHLYGQVMMNMSLRSALKTPAFDEPIFPLMNKARMQKDTYGVPCEPQQPRSHYPSPDGMFIAAQCSPLHPPTTSHYYT